MLGTGAVTATVAALEPKGLRARLRRAKPRNLAIAGAVAASVLAAVAVLGFLFLGPAHDQDRPAQYAFDSDAVHRVTDGVESSSSPADATAPGDPNPLWNYDVSPLTPTGPSGTSKYMPPYRSGTSGKFIPYTPPNGSSGSSGGGDSGGDAAGPAPRPMPAGTYSYNGSGTVPVAFWSKIVPVPGTVTATVTAGDGGCSGLAIAAGGTTVSSSYCAVGGSLGAGPRSRTVQNGQITMTCSGPLLPAGAQAAGDTQADCTASAGSASEKLIGVTSVADAGSTWVATTSVSGPNGDYWTEHVSIDKAGGNVVALRSEVRFALLAYQESSAFTLR